MFIAKNERCAPFEDNECNVATSSFLITCQRDYIRMNSTNSSGEDVPLSSILFGNGNPLETILKAPARVYHAMGRFGRIVTMPIWIFVLVPLHYLGAASIILCLLPLWFCFAMVLPFLLGVIALERSTMYIARVFARTIDFSSFGGSSKDEVVTPSMNQHTKSLSHTIKLATTRSNPPSTYVISDPNDYLELLSVAARP